MGRSNYKVVMNKVLIALVCCLSFSVANCQEATEDSAQVDVAEVDTELAHDELRALKQDVTDAVNNANWEALPALLSENVIVTWMDGTCSHGRDEVLEYMKSKTEGDSPIVDSFKISVDVTDLADFHGPSTATAYGMANSEFVLRGRTMALTGPWSGTVIRDGGEWKIAQIHASIGVFDSPLLAWAWRFAWIIGAIALFVGLLIGWLVGRRRKTVG